VKLRAIAPVAIAALVAGLACGPADRRAATAPADAPGRGDAAAGTAQAGFVGSSSCRECHERFYELWAPSHHGLAMQPFTPALAQTRLTPQTEDVVIGETRYRAEIAGTAARGTTAGVVVERGPAGERRFAITEALGGKNVFYFLTPLERGRLQVLPLAYDLNTKAWFDTTLSAVRNPGRGREEVVHWMEPALTFNTSCFSCHVSQLQSNYDLATDTYRTTWREPGINCETCHGPCADHVRVCREAGPGKTPADLKIIRLKLFDEQKTNDACAPCHARMSPITADFRAGERFFDHFDLVAFEHDDFYPDGRDLGENYTHTLWMTSPCAQSGRLDCVFCHTSSGRWRQREAPDDSCRPCHEDKVKDSVAHTHHAAGKPGGRCVDCHMPGTWFARMARHDHSMRPPTPAATIAFGSPNACNLCHTDKDARWADGWVRRWRPRDYQAPILARAALIDAARRRDWSRLPAMLAYLRDPGRDDIFAASLVALLRSCDRDARWPATVAGLDDRAPLVRARAAEGLRDHLTPETVAALARAAGDPVRLVRVRAAASLAAVPPGMIDPVARATVDSATSELEASLQTRPDDATAHYNLAGLLMDRKQPDRAIAEYLVAIRLRPEIVPFQVNLGMAYVALGNSAQAEAAFRRALELAPANAAAQFNLGLLLGEGGRRTEAIAALRAALVADPKMAAAAYNLGVLLADEEPAAGLGLCLRAAKLQPDNPKYAWTVAFYQARAGDLPGAARVLERVVRAHPEYADAWALLGDTYLKEGRPGAARALYRRAAGETHLPADARAEFSGRLGAMEQGSGRR
jgi:tetratricopeptide (TPR) repeat protein